MEVRTVKGWWGALRIGMRAAGPGGADRPPLLIFNGLGASLELLEPLAAALPEPALMVIDAPGVGTSPPLFPYRFWALAWLTRQLMREAGWGDGPVDVLGVSWGGCLAQQFALQFPRQCRRLILAATSPGTLMVPGRPAAFLNMVRLALHPGEVGATRWLDPVFGRSPDTGTAAVLRHGLRAGKSDFLSQAGQLLALWGWTSLPWLGRIAQPTLILAGEDDPVVPPANARLLAALIPVSRLRFFPDGHGFLLTRAGQAAAEVDTFLTAPEGALEGR
ncbi:MAG: alpha/beta fold hydrolase [Zoogloeaceae bacterium]|nr:alpha/beta fold hydrolase [Zoogloeaceae bacterium]